MVCIIQIQPIGHASSLGMAQPIRIAYMTSNTFAVSIYQLHHSVACTIRRRQLVIRSINQFVYINREALSIQSLCALVYDSLSHKERRRKYQSNDQFVHPSKLCVLCVYGPMRIMLVNFVFAPLCGCKEGKPF